MRTVALDKTGTLTLGVPRLTEIVTLDGRDEDAALRDAAALERHSEHPLAAALVARRPRARPATGGGRTPSGRSPACGAEATVDGRALWAGGPRLAAERLGRTPPALAELEARGRTAIVLGEEDRALAAVRAGRHAAPRGARGDRRAARRGRRASGDAHRRQPAGRRPARRASSASASGAPACCPRRSCAPCASSRPPPARRDGRRRDQRRTGARRRPRGRRDGRCRHRRRHRGRRRRAALRRPAAAARGGGPLARPRCGSCARTSWPRSRSRRSSSRSPRSAWSRSVMAVAADMGMSLLVTLNGLRLLRRR